METISPDCAAFRSTVRPAHPGVGVRVGVSVLDEVPVGLLVPDVVAVGEMVLLPVDVEVTDDVPDTVGVGETVRETTFSDFTPK